MKRKILLRPALAALASALLAFTLYGLSDAVAARAARQSDSQTTQGSLYAIDPTGKAASACPLKHTDVRAEVSGFISRVTVTQEFENPFTDKIEAVYVFPLPQAAAVDDMTMEVGGRTIKGRIMRREEAQAVYREARERGQIASLLDQERPNVFTQSVANILPGQSIKVVISYVETLKYEAGTYEWSFPMVVGQRYIPVGAADAAGVNPPVMPEGVRAGHAISVEVAIDAGVPLEGVTSVTHAIEVERRGAAGAVVRLKDAATIPNKDFVLKYDVAGGRVEDALLTHAAGGGGYFALILQPPDRVAPAEITPKELVFVLDTSGSMSGFPIEKAKETMKLALEGLNPQDTFNLVTFAGDTHVLFEEPVPATPNNLSKAQEFLASRSGGGGTEMMKAIRAALDPSDSSDHVRVVCFMTDGWVGNESEIIGEVQRHPNARVFSMGFGTAPNRYLLDQMAEHGRGEVEYVAEGDDHSAAARRFHERVRSPLLTDLSVEWAGLPVADLYPKRVPDLFSARPLILLGRYAGEARGVVRLKGRMAGLEFAREIEVELPAVQPSHDVLATLWARRRVDELMGRNMRPANADKALQEEVTRLGLDYRLMTQFTSFVAVEEQVVTDGGEPRRVDVPVEAPPSSPTPKVTEQSVAGLPMRLASGAAGTATETVSVTACASYVETSETRALDLPIKGRSIHSLAVLSPGVVAAGGPTAPGGFSFNGQRPHSNTFVIDGVSANVGIEPGGQSPGASASGAAPGLTAGGGANGLAQADAAKEFTVHAVSVEPEYGRTPGAQLSVTTRAGTNGLHGSLFGYFGDEALDANDWFANSLGRGRQPRRLADYGGTLGGPLKRDQLFFFGAYEGQRQRQPAFAFTEVPTLAARLAASDAVRPFLEAFPLPTGAARADGFAESAEGFSTPAGLDSFSFRFDGSTEKLLLDARYAVADSEADGRGAGGASLNTLSRTRTLAQTLTGGFSYAATATTLWKLRANYSRVSARGSRLLDAFGGAAVPGALLSKEGGAFVFDLGGRGAALGSAAEVTNRQRQLNLVGSLDHVSGTHFLKFGADYRRLSPVIGAFTTERTVYFEGVAGALSNTAARDGLFTRASEGRPVFHNLSAYAQDQWRGTSRLVLNYGLRWELSPAPHAGGGQRPIAFTQVEDAARLSFAAADAPLWETTYFNFEPRAGLAYDPAGNGKTVVRAGLVLLYDTGVEEAGHAFGDSHPFLAGGAAFGVPFTIEGPSITAGARLGVPVSAFDPHLKLPYTLRWHGSVERALGSGHSVSATYVGAAGRRLLLTRTLLDPSPDFSLARVTTNGGRSDYHSARFQFTRRLSQGLQAMASYTWAKSIDDFSEDAPARALLRGDAERGASDFDARHAASGFASYDLPTPFGRGVWNALSRRWALDALFNARSAKPVNIVYGFPVAYGFAFLRPDLSSGVPLYIFDQSIPGGRRLNPAAFVVPGTLRQGTLGRNALRGFPFYQLDLALRRQFDFNERVNLQVRAEAFNLLNHPNFDDPAATLAFLGTTPGGATALRLDPYFGRSVSARGGGEWVGEAGGFGPLYTSGGARTVQVSLKLTF